MSVKSLSRIEVWSCGVIWFVGVSYAMFNTYLATQKFCEENPGYCRLQPGWFMGRNVDRQNDWNTWTHFIVLTLAPWWLVHLIGAEITRKHAHKYLPVWYIAIGFVFYLKTFGLSSISFFLLFTSTYLIMRAFRSKLLLWFVSFAALYYTYPLLRIWFGTFGWPLYPDVNVLGAMMGWTILRCIGFISEHIDSKSPSITRDDLVKYYAYIFYLPVMYSGPIINYDTFLNGMNLSYKPWTVTRFFVSSFNILRIAFWMVATDLAYHYTYFGSMQRSIQTVLQLDNWALYGLVWCLGFYFMLCYVVSYGFASAVAGVEQMSVAPKPACVGRISLYSNMWRYFDRGLYLFMVKYIYLPCLGERKGFVWRLIGSTATFVFIYIYHGIQDYVLVWTVVNYLEVTVESVGKAIGSMPSYQKLERHLLSPQNSERFYAALASPLMAVSALSNMYFIGNSMQLGNAFTHRILNDGWLVQLMVFGFCFCASQANIAYQRHADNKKQCKAKTK